MTAHRYGSSEDLVEAVCVPGDGDVVGGAGAEPAVKGDRTECVWLALSPTRRETLASLPHEPAVERRLERIYDSVPAREIEAATAQCGAEGPEAWVNAQLSITAVAERQAAEASLRSGYTSDRLAAAVAPFVAEIERGFDGGDASAIAGPQVLAGRFADSLGAVDPAERQALARYLEASAFSMLARKFWVSFDAWVAAGRPYPEPNDD